MGWLQRAKEQGRPEHVPGVHHSPPGHRWPPELGLRVRPTIVQPLRLLPPISPSLHQQFQKWAGSPEIYPSLAEGLGVLVSGQYCLPRGAHQIQSLTSKGHGLPPGGWPGWG